MLRPRIIPCLLATKRGLVKTIQFGSPKYVGDPINAVKIFNEKEVDELSIFDIEATTNGREPNYGLIQKIATECRMPLCYGGGIKTVEQIVRIIKLGVEKVALSSAAIKNPELVNAAARYVGNQSIVVVLDVKGSGKNNWNVVVNNGKTETGINAIKYAGELQSRGVGEIVFNSVDLDGMMSGYDLNLARCARENLNVPITFLGGAGCLAHLGELFESVGVVGAAAGSLFVFKGSLRAVLINYPNMLSKTEIASRAYQNKKFKAGL